MIMIKLVLLLNQTYYKLTINYLNIIMHCNNLNNEIKNRNLKVKDYCNGNVCHQNCYFLFILIKFVNLIKLFFI